MMLAPWMLTALALGVSVPEPAPQVIRRFALITGVNDGGAGRVRLRYAGSDAEAVARVLEELGGVFAADRLLLLDPDRRAFEAGIDELKARMQRARGEAARIELLVYYSGHSDEEGLLLQGERFEYGVLRRRLDALPADVRIAILDSCSSGALTRQKGGKMRPPFLVDESAEVRGHAFLTSSSEHEAAQESDRIGASFFTHYLISGLRGAADVTADGRVTLGEAYQFAYAETLARTERTQSGPQHAAYDIQLAGTGDLVMTDLRSPSASLVLAKDVGGRLYVRDARQRLVAELYKPAGRVVSLGISPGSYQVALEHEGVLFMATLELAEGEHTELAASALSRVERERTARRGDVESADPWPELSLRHAKPLRVVPVAFSVTPQLAYPKLGDDDVSLFALNLIFGDVAWQRGLALAYGANSVRHDASGGQLALGMNRVGGEMRGIQVAVGSNIVSGRMQGLQTAVGVSYANELAAGLQVSTGANLANRADGIQISAGVNYADEQMRGVQIGALVNYGGHQMQGLQVGALGNYAGDMEGVQVAGVASYARRLEGAQIAVVNVAGESHGAQIGVVNIAGKSRGPQLGIVNVAEEADFSLGLLSLIGNGEHRLDVWATTTEPYNFSLRLGTKHVYSLWSLHVLRPDISGRRPLKWSPSFGLGAHATRGDAFFDVDISAGNVHFEGNSENNIFGRVRALAGWRLRSHLALFAGAAYNGYAGFHGEDDPKIAESPLFPVGQAVEREQDVIIRKWPSLLLGAQF